MSNDDDIERLLREIDGVTGSGPTAQPPAKRPESAPVKAESRIDLQQVRVSGGEVTP